MGCRRRSAPDRLVRVAVGEGGSLAVGRQLPGRGAWLCRDDPGCVDLALARRAFDRALRARFDEEAGASLRTSLRSLTGGPGGARMKESRDVRG